MSQDDISSQTPKADDSFHALNIDIPSGGLDDLASPALDFSKRGSMFIGGKKANSPLSGANGQLGVGTRRIPSVQSSPRLEAPVAKLKMLSAEEESLSQKVRRMYEIGNNDSTTFDDRSSGHYNEARTQETPSLPGSAVASATDLTSNGSIRAPHSLVRKPSYIKRESYELAGGIEDWQDVIGGDVDRYGFIIQRQLPSEVSSTSLPKSSPEPQPLRRVPTSLQLASDTPRRKHTIRRAVSNAQSTRSSGGIGLSRQISRRSRRPSSQGSNHSSVGASNPRLRYAANRLPHNKDRRLMDEAGDMLTLPPGLADIAENGEGGQAQESKKKEIDRNDKWLKMARLVTKNNDGGGMNFDFDTSNPKLIDRTWKGIPDRWRATAWHAFLTASAKRVQGSVSDEDLISIFHEYQDKSSPDDVQIDIDVPRTINSHIMFRRRYRGGQRLLFRVLHAMSLYFPDTGYVQGMATLAATLLCYYDEDNTFVMLVRLWQLRGLDRLYQSGFGGLMEALDDFEKKWLDGGEVAVKLVR
jgi:hypothetical protein